jgi:hypothetical protein
MQRARQHVALAAAGGTVFALGGYDRIARLASVERYDPVADAWLDAAVLGERKLAPAACVLRGQLLAVGGFTGSRAVASVERLGLDGVRWLPAVPMLQARYGAGAAVL